MDYKQLSHLILFTLFLGPVIYLFIFFFSCLGLGQICLEQVTIPKALAVNQDEEVAIIGVITPQSISVCI